MSACADERVLICEDGDVITLTPEGARSSAARCPRATCTSTASSVTSATACCVIGAALSEEGVVVVIVTVDTQRGEVVTGPEIVTRGWVYAPEAEDLIEDAKQAVSEAIDDAIAKGAPDLDTMRRHAAVARRGSSTSGRSAARS